MRTKHAPQLAILAAALLIAAGCSSGDADTTTTTTAPDTTTTVATTSTTATTTTTAPETTTSSSSTTSSSTTTTVAETTTTTAPVDATIELSDEGIQAGTIWVPFGTMDEEAIDDVAAVIGDPTQDSGWIGSFSVYGTCPGAVVRGVHWDSFVMLFTQADTDFWTGGVPHFFAFYYTNTPPELATTEGMYLGDTIELLTALYGGPKLEIDEAFFDPSVGTWSYDRQSWTGLWGFSTGQNPDDTITSINGGRGCGE